MASTENSKRGTIIALLCGAVGFGIVIYALFQEQTVSQIAQPVETETTVQTVEETTQTASVAKPEETAPTQDVEPQSSTDSADVVAEPEAPAEEPVEIVEDSAPDVQDTMEGDEPADVAKVEAVETEEIAESKTVNTEPTPVGGDQVQEASQAPETRVEIAESEPVETVGAEPTPVERDQVQEASKTPETTVEIANTEPEAKTLTVEVAEEDAPDEVTNTPQTDDTSETMVARVEPEVSPTQTSPEVEESVASVEPGNTPVQEEPAEPVVVAAVPESADVAPELDANDPSVPKFDLVRVEADGSAVIAGRAEPNAEVKIYSNGEEIGSATSSSKGEFVALIQTEVTETAQSLALLAENPSGPTVASRSSVILLGREAQVNSDGTGETVSLPPAIIQTNRDEVRVIQPVIGLADLDRVSLDSISYDQEGRVILAGRGRPMNIARIYADQNVVADVEISRGGAWSVVLKKLDAGRYTLRVDELDAEGAVLSRVETPFQREFPTAEKLALLSDDKQVIVQPGNNLWTIAENRYGLGFRYTVIFEANKEQIRDPDLIYPGQVFALPAEAQ